MIDVEELHKIATALGTTASAIMSEVESKLARDELAARRASKRVAVQRRKASRTDKDPDA